VTTPSAPDPYSPDPQSPGTAGYPGAPGGGYPNAPGGSYPTGGQPAPGYPAPGYPAPGYPTAAPGPGYPAPGSTPSYPPQGAAPGGWSAPPGAYPAPTTGLPAATGRRPGFVTAAAVLAFVVGGLTIITGLISFSVLSTLNVGGFYVVIIILAILVAIGLVWGGVQALGGKDGRILVAAAGAGIVVNVISMITYFTAGSLLSFVIPILIIAFMLQATTKQWLDSKGAAHF
jgi:hypothetical protein